MTKLWGNTYSLGTMTLYKNYLRIQIIDVFAIVNHSSGFREFAIYTYLFLSSHRTSNISLTLLRKMKHFRIPFFNL